MHGIAVKAVFFYGSSRRTGQKGEKRAAAGEADMQSFERRAEKMHEGHRLRMYEKLKNYPDALQEHELLEILLYNAAPRINTNPLAHRLLDEFGSLRAIFEADVSALQAVEGVGLQLAGYIKCIDFFLQAYGASQEKAMPVRYETESFRQYLAEYYAPLSYEVFCIFVIGEKNRILCCKKFTDKESGSVTVPPQELTRLAVQYAGKAFVLAHNHVVGACRPSAGDDNLTIQCEVICSINNVRLLDHYIYSREGIYSYYLSGRMANIANNYHIRRVMGRRDDGKD